MPQAEHRRAAQPLGRICVLPPGVRTCKHTITQFRSRVSEFDIYLYEYDLYCIMIDEYDTSSKGFSIASLVMGILGIIGFSTGFSFVFSLLAIVFAALCMKRKQGIKGLAITGLVLGIIGLSIWAIIVVIVGGILGLAVLFSI